uniref:Uncharacterized protein n=1 Tax=Myotis myotis TaxID=51298 RepID=A0A7J7ZXS7_MYOMY|nr:hypothetical protein mMyoMyo1_009596 [Myotis myotis]
MRAAPCLLLRASFVSKFFNFESVVISFISQFLHQRPAHLPCACSALGAEDKTAQTSARPSRVREASECVHVQHQLPAPRGRLPWVQGPQSARSWEPGTGLPAALCKVNMHSLCSKITKDLKTQP